MRSSGRTFRGRSARMARAALRELRAPVTWELVDPRAPGDRFAGRSVVVTGAGGLIGSALVHAYVAQGAFVHAVDVDVDALGRLGDALARGHAGGSARMRPHAVDLQDPEAISSLTASLDTVDILVNNAGFNDRTTSAAELSAESWRRVLDVNLVGPALLTGQLVPQLSSRPGGAVVFVTSLLGTAPSRWVHYGAAKAGLAKLVVDLAHQLAPAGVRVNAIAPGAVMNREDSGDRRAVATAALGGGAVPVEAIVHAVEFLSDSLVSPMTTGQQLFVDAGLRRP